MTKKQIFINVIDGLIENSSQEYLGGDLHYADFMEYWENFKKKEEKDPNALTEKGIKLLSFMQKTADENENKFSSQIISDGTGILPRSVSGSMRRLVDLKLVYKIAGNPVMYCLTEDGKNRKVEE